MRDVVTTVLELLAVLAFASAAGLAAGAWMLWAGAAAAGVVCVAASWLILRVER